MGTITKKISKILGSKIFIFAIATISMFILTYKYDLISASMDAQETWKVATTFFSEDKYYSYVMYKGIYAFLPSVFDYLVSTALNIPCLYIVKAFNALCFGYVSVYGIPFLVQSIHKNKFITVWQRYLLVFLLIIFESNINYFLSVDMISCTMFFMLCNSVIKATQNDNLRWYNCIVLGLLFGINMCLSGQFAISTVIVAAAFLINFSYKHFKKHGIPNIKNHIPWAYAIILIFIGYFITRTPNQLYMDLVVWKAKADGAWIPTGSEWIVNGLSANLLIINYPMSLPDHLSMQLLTDAQREIVSAGGTVFTYSDYFKLILQNPFTFIVRWSERLFLGMINDPRNIFPCSAIPALGKYTNALLVSMVSIVYVFYDQFKERFKKYKDFISVELAIYIGFLFSALVPTFGHVENRYYFTARCLLFGVFAMSPFLNNATISIKNKIKNRKEIQVSYRFWGCIIFIILALVIYYAIYQG